MTEEDKARERLAEEMHYKMELLDCSAGKPWSQLSDHRKAFYRLVLDHVLDFEDLVRCAVDGSRGGRGVIDASSADDKHPA